MRIMTDELQRLGGERLGSFIGTVHFRPAFGAPPVTSDGEALMLEVHDEGVFAFPLLPSRHGERCLYSWASIASLDGWVSP